MFNTAREPAIFDYDNVKFITDFVEFLAQFLILLSSIIDVKTNRKYLNILLDNCYYNAVII